MAESNGEYSSHDDQDDSDKDEIEIKSSSSLSSTSSTEPTIHRPNPLELLSEDVGDLWASFREVRVLSSPPSSLEFLRDYVSPSIPCIIRNAIVGSCDNDCDQDQTQDEPLHVTLDQLVELSGDCVVTVNVTPDGHGDCVRHILVNEDDHDQQSCRMVKMFVKPEERKMTLRDFRYGLRCRIPQCPRTTFLSHSSLPRADLKNYPLCQDQNSLIKDDLMRLIVEDSNSVLYYSQQNDCLRTELPTLFQTNIFPSTFKFAEEAFGTGGPEAINLWIGDERAVSSMHKDHYENLFYVCSGEKVFTLCPPADAPFLHAGEFPSGTFCQLRPASSDSQARWEVVSESQLRLVSDASDETDPVIVKWIEPDIYDYYARAAGDTSEEDAEFPLLKLAHPIQVRLKAGEMLYLPSLWFHRVTQSVETVGVNYWYDMKFDAKWCYFNFLQRLGEKISSEEFGS